MRTANVFHRFHFYCLTHAHAAKLWNTFSFSNIFRHLESHHILNDFKHCCRQFQSSEIKLTGFEFINVAKDLQNIYDRRTWCVCHRFLKSRDNCAAWRTCVYHIKNISWILFYAVKKILRAIHKGITSFFFFYLIPVLQTAPILRVTIKQKALLRQRLVVVIIGLNYCALGRFAIVRTDWPHQSPTSYFENEIGFFQEFSSWKTFSFVYTI